MQNDQPHSFLFAWFRFLTLLVLVGLAIVPVAAHAGAEQPAPIDGDVGLGAYYTSSIVRGHSSPVTVLPYGYFDYGRLFLRIDTLGIKTLPLGYGHLEVVARYLQDGFQADTPELAGLHDRQASLPLGIGTMQITPVGAFFINAFRDINQSGGNLFETIYVAKASVRQLSFYPLAGFEFLSSSYVRYYYGISSPEAATSSYAAYRPDGSLNPMLGLMIDADLGNHYHLGLYLRRRWLGKEIQDSPIVTRSTLDTRFIELSYRFN